MECFQSLVVIIRKAQQAVGYLLYFYDLVSKIWFPVFLGHLQKNEGNHQTKICDFICTLFLFCILKLYCNFYFYYLRNKNYENVAFSSFTYKLMYRREPVTSLKYYLKYYFTTYFKIQLQLRIGVMLLEPNMYPMSRASNHRATKSWQYGPLEM